MKTTLLSLLALAALTACQPSQPDAAGADSAAAAAAPGPAPGSTEWKIETYASAAPAELATNATVMDFDSAGALTVELRKGTNGWTCMPFNPPPPGGYTTPASASPACMDAMAGAWGTAWATKATPKLASMGLAYMLHGDTGASMTDPWAKAETPDNQWVVEGPHVMVLPSDVNSIKNLSTDHKSGGPYVMWAGTQYAHVMMPIGEPK